MLILITSALLIVVFLLLLWRFMKVQQQEEENSMIALHLETEQAYYNALSKQAESIRQFRHDLAGHIRTLEYLMKSEDREELLPYLEQLQEQHRSVSVTPYTSNEIVNALICGFADRCIHKGYDFIVTIKGYISTDGRDILDLSAFTEASSSAASGTVSSSQSASGACSAMRIVDFCALVGNLLENALEECDRIAASEPKPLPDSGSNGPSSQIQAQKKQISLSITQTRKEICLSVQNPLHPGNPLTFKSGKRNPEEHGIGNAVIHHVIENCCGTIADTVTPNQCLRRAVSIPMPKKSSPEVVA